MTQVNFTCSISLEVAATSEVINNLGNIAEECKAEHERDRLLPTNELWTTNAASAFLQLAPNSECGISYSGGQCARWDSEGVDCRDWY